MTRDQAHSKPWLSYRARRTTASNFKGVPHTDHLQPSLSLLKKICYQESNKFNSTATTWGCNHKKYARDCYVEKVSENHSKFTVSDKRLVVHPNFPQFGTSPDGFINCDSCGCGVVEIKCPYSCIGRSFLEASKDKSFCLEVSDQGNLTLKRNHAYFDQLQLQMKLCNVEYGDLVLWRPDELLIPRILRDDTFLNDTMDKATKLCCSS